MQKGRDLWNKVYSRHFHQLQWLYFKARIHRRFGLRTDRLERATKFRGASYYSDNRAVFNDLRWFHDASRRRDGDQRSVVKYAETPLPRITYLAFETSQNPGVFG